MDRLNFPLTRIIPKPYTIKNNSKLGFDEVTTLLHADKYLQKRIIPVPFYPSSKGKTMFNFEEETHFILDEVNTENIKITTLQEDVGLYSLYIYILAAVLLNIFFPLFRPFILCFVVIGLMGLAIITMGNKVSESRIKSKIHELAKAINQTGD